MGGATATRAGVGSLWRALISARISWFDLTLASLAAVLTGGTIVFLVEPSLRLVVDDLALDLIIEVGAALVAGAVAGLALIRYREFDDPPSLVLASAFLVLCISSAAYVATIVAHLAGPMGIDPSAAGQVPL